MLRGIWTGIIKFLKIPIPHQDRISISSEIVWWIVPVNSIFFFFFLNTDYQVVLTRDIIFLRRFSAVKWFSGWDCRRFHFSKEFSALTFLKYVIMVYCLDQLSIEVAKLLLMILGKKSPQCMAVHSDIS